MQANDKPETDHALRRAAACSCSRRDDSPSSTGLETKVVTKRPPTEAGDGRDAVRLAGGEAREVQRHRLRRRTTARSASAPARCRAWMPRRIAVWKADEAGLSLKGSAVGERRILSLPGRPHRRRRSRRDRAIQPGGSVRDPEVIAAADERKMAMVFTGVRHFRH